MYVSGFREAPFGAPINELDALKGNVQLPAPVIEVDEDDELRLTVTNIGLVIRPDLDDAHTVHFHGFRNQISIFDGVPEASIAIPPGRDFPYVFRPHEEGTYLYHCHFDDVAHIQMGMIGIIIVRPAQNSGPPIEYGGENLSKFAFPRGAGASRP